MTSQDIENEITALQAALETESSPLRQIMIRDKLDVLTIGLARVLEDERKARILQEKKKQTRLL